VSEDNYFKGRPERIQVDEYRSQLSRSSITRPENNFYHWLLATTWFEFFILVIFVYLSANIIFALAYLACGDGAITNARPGSIVDAFFFSVQTMATIGYGRMTPVGSWTNAIVTFEAFIGIVYSALTTGLAFARFTRPTAGIRFTSVAVVTLHNGVRVLKFRIANERKSQIVEAQMRMWLVGETMTAEGEHYRQSVELKIDHPETPVFSLTWSAMHFIDEVSPLAKYIDQSIDNASYQPWHLLVTFTGYHESLANQVYARHVYMPQQIQHHANFVDIVTVSSDGRHVIDLANFEKWAPLIFKD
jgi:inward rectifier potassium channel